MLCSARFARFAIAVSLTALPFADASAEVFAFQPAAPTQIVAYEYWFDQDYSQATYTTVSPTNEFTLDLDLPTDGLSLGLHTVNIRFLDEIGNWSSVLSQFFTKLPTATAGQRQVVAYEYWFDNDWAQAVEVPLSPAAEVIVLNDLPTTGLGNGLHTFHIRFRDDAGQWSSVLSQFFTKLPPATAGQRQVVAYEYWFDNDWAQAVEVPLSPAAEVIVLDDLPTTGLGNGLHTFHIRFRDDSGQWSSVLSQFFTKLPPATAGQRQVVAYEYWFDNAWAQAVEVPLSPAAEVIVLDDLPTTGLGNGLHTFHIRFRDDSGQWSSVLSQFFTKLPPATAGQRQIVAYEYWFDNAWAQAVEVPLSPAAEVIVLDDLPTTGLGNGLHTFHIRFRDDAGQWNSVSSQFFTKLTAQNADNKIAGYRYWLDLNFADAVTVVLPTPVDVLILDEDLDFSALPPAPHVLHTQFFDLNGAWSAVTSDTFNIGLPPQASFTPEVVPCKNGQVKFNNTSSYATSWQWNFGDGGTSTQAMPTHTYAAPGTYTVTLTVTDDSNGSTSSFTATAEAQFLQPNVSVSTTASSCFNSNDGSITATGSNGAEPFSFTWSNDQTGATLNGLSPGSYTVTATSAEGCTATGGGVVPNGSNLSVSMVIIEQATCQTATNGQAQLNVQNGVPPYSYFWSNGETTGTAIQLAAGPISATVTDAAGCALTASATMGYSSDFSAYVVPSNLTTCPDSEDGEAQAFVQNGVPPYSYLWSNGATTEIATGFGVGPFSATITDAAGCVLTASAYMDYGSDIFIDIELLESPSCPGSEDGSATVILSPFNFPPYTILWSNGENADTAAALPAGPISVTLIDGNGCTATASEYLPAPMPLTVAAETYAPSCFGSTDGSAVLFPDGGAPPYTFSWSNGDTSSVVTDLSAGTYTVTATDAKGCTATATCSVSEPPELAIQANHTDISCAFASDGTATAVPSGGTPPYTVLWSNGANGLMLTDLPPDHYSATVTDSKGCTTVSNDAWVTQPGELQLSLQASDAPCGNDGSIATTVNGGTQPYAYDWSHGATVQNPAGLPEGFYYLVVTDANGCQTSATATVNAQNNAPTFSFTGNPGFTNAVVNPPGGSPYQTYRFEARYTDAEGELPQAGYPRIYLDFEGDGNLFGANDRTYLLSPVDPTDADVTDGKDYFAVVTGIPPSPNYKTVLRAIDAAGCTGDFGPLDGPFVVDDADVFLFANDIQFSNPHPEPLEAITVSATIHNESDFAAENFVCRLTNMNTGQVFALMTVASLPAHSTTQLSWDIITPPDPSWNPMKVELDVTNVLDEPNELDNQAIRPFINGAYNLPGSIEVLAAVQPNPSSLAPLTQLNLNGSAVYTGTAVPLADSSCAGASVIFTLVETGQTFGGFTDLAGKFSIYFPQPPAPGVYHISGTVTDYTLSTAFSVEFTVNPLPCVKPDLIVQLLPTAYSLVQGNTLGGSVRVSNSGNAPSVTTRLRLFTPNGSPSTTLLDVPALSIGASANLNLPGITFPNTGTTYLQAEVDFEYLNEECQENNNFSTASLTVTPALPDIVPTWWNTGNTNLPICGNYNFTYRVENKGGSATGSFSTKWEVWKGGVLEFDSVVTVASIATVGSVFLTFPYTFDLLGDYELKLSCDFTDAVTEHSELNNDFNRTVHIYSCPTGPDLKFNGCQALQVLPVDPAGSGDITITATLVNQGSAPALAPFNVELSVGPNSYVLTITDDLGAGQSLPISFTIPQPPFGSNNFTLIADADNQVAELQETNNTVEDALDWNFSLGQFCCSSCMFWQKPVTTPSLWFSVGLFNGGQYQASAVEVQFEISGPGLNDWVDLGKAVVNNLDKTCTSCPAGAGLPNPFTFPATGTYTVRMTADPDNLYPESNEGDNVLTVQVSVRPDMRVLSQYIAPSTLHPDPDEPVVFTVSYDNIGFSNPTDSMELLLLVNESPWDSARVSGLLTGDHYSVQFPAPWTSNIVGQHVARAVIDHDQEIVESTETNNEATRAFIVGEAPNLRFVSLTPNDYHPSVGQTLVVTAVLENNGDLSGAGTYRLSYVTDSGDTIPIFTKAIALAAGQQQTEPFVWQVLDAHTVLVGEIVNSSPLEFRYDDNSIFAVLGGLEVEVSTSPELCIPYTGSAAATVSEGTPPYFYNWSTGQLSASIDGLGAGNYALSVTDAQGLQGVAYFAVAHKSGPELSFSVTKATCDKNDGAVAADVEYAVPPVSIVWSTGATTAGLNGLVPAVYTVTVSDGLGCVAEESVIVGFDGLQAGSGSVCTVSHPMIQLEKGVVNIGESQTIRGKIFFSNGRAVVFVSGAQAGLVNTEVPTDSEGKFLFDFSIPTGTSAGQYQVNVRDLVSGYSAPVKYFEVVDPNPQAIPGLRITRPVTAADVVGCSTQTVEWDDYIVRKQGGYLHHGHQRQFKYIVELSRSGGPWEVLGKNEGFASFGTAIHRSFDYEAPKPGTVYKLRVRDFFDTGNSDTSTDLESVASSVSGNCYLKWDYSYPTHPLGHPKGVAADGTARVYVVAKGPGLHSASIALAANKTNQPAATIEDSTTLGTVMLATVTHTYDNEANFANQINAQGTANANSEVYFWYVAPDDFVREPGDAALSERKVYAFLTLSFQDGSQTRDTIPIEIVRPPLMLVHGLGGDEKSWDNFRSSSGLLRNDERFKVRYIAKMHPTAAFDVNANMMVLGTNKPIPQTAELFYDDPKLNPIIEIPAAHYPCLPCAVKKIRDLGYAANRVDYIGHSMGGSVLRQVLTSFKTEFYRSDNAENFLYKNYRKGFTNKVITLGTPHKGSWLAYLPYVFEITAINEVIYPEWYKSLIYHNTVKNSYPLKTFIKKSNSGVSFQVTDAVKDLRQQAGEEFDYADIKAHLISGDYTIATGILDGFINLNDKAFIELDQHFKAFASVQPEGTFEQLQNEIRSIIGNTAKLHNRAIDYLLSFGRNTISENLSVIHSDMVVLVSSQLNSESESTSTAVKEFSGIVHNNTFENFPGAVRHLASKSEANHVLNLLNSEINSNYFAPLKETKNNLTPSSTIQKKGSGNCLVSVSTQDTSNIKIVDLLTSSIIPVDSMLNISIQIIDTLGLAWGDIFFQGDSYSLPNNFIGTYQFELAAGSSLLDSQAVTLIAHYIRNDSCITVYQTKSIFVDPNYTPIGFEVFPEENYLYTGESIGLEYQMDFPNENSEKSLLSLSIDITIDDTSKVGYSTLSRQFFGKNPGVTFAVVTYKNFQDTAYFIVLPLLEQLSDIAPPLAAFTFTESLPCQGGAIHLENQSLNADTYLWDFGDGATSTETAPTHQYQQAGYHQVLLTATNAQTGQTDVYSVAIEIEIDSIGVHIETADGSEPCIGDPLTLHAIGTPGLAFQWQLDGVDLEDSTRANIVVGAEGVYRVVATNAEGCTAISNEIALDAPCGNTLTGLLLWQGDGATGIELATVNLTGAVLDSDGPTPASGAFTLQAGLGGNVVITPLKTINLLNGIDAADLTAIQQHVTGINTITDFFRLVAADANKSYTISTLDASLLRQALLGNPQAIAIMKATKSWRFIPTNYSYPNPAGPYTLPVFPETRNLLNVSASISGLDFYGVKVGDVHESGAIADPGNKPDPSAKPLVWTARDRLLKAGEPVDVQFSTLNFTDIAAFQFALRFDTAQLRFERIEVLAKDLPMDVGGNFGLFNVNGGELRIVWNAVKGVSRPDPTPMFRVHFTALKSGQLLSQTLQPDAAILPSVAYNTSLVARELLVVFTDYRTPPGVQKRDSEAAEIPAFQLLPNRPNPFSESTVIGFILPEACAAQLRVMNINGRVLWQISGNFSAGYQEQTVSWNDLQVGGVLFYELSSPFGALVRRMVLVGK